MLKHHIRDKQKMTRVPPFYNVHDDDFYHGPAWVIKPRLYPPKENLTEKSGPGYYHIPDRSIYHRPGQTMGDRYETPAPVTSQLLGHYSPNDYCTSSAQIPTISITPRRMRRIYGHDYSERLYLPSDRACHSRAPLLRPLYSSIISRKSLDLKLSPNSPGPAAYPMYEFDEDILPRPQSGVTQKHRFSPAPSSSPTNPPFYYPKIADRHRLPSFTISRCMHSSKKTNQSATPFYSSFDNRDTCSNFIKPGATLKGRWSPLVCIPNFSDNNQKRISQT